MPFVPHTEQERQAMLAAIGVDSLDALYHDIPAALRLSHLDLPAGLSEQEVYDRMRALAGKNRVGLNSFLGGGGYDHTIPAAVDSLASRGEFFTAYTPYQPEVAQGTLQAIFEFQTMVCRLTGLDAANASMYDGGSALVEAIIAAVNATGRDRVLLAGNVNPLYRRMVATYTANLGIEVITLPATLSEVIDRTALAANLDDKVAAVVLQSPDFFGGVGEYGDVAELTHQAGALLLVSAYPVALGLLRRPGEMGADIVTAEGQSLGLPLAFGGPWLGLFAVREKLVRRMPGRIVGATVDRHGQRAFVLTLQAREQHIRREKATSNICTNQALCALRATIHLSLLGRQGLREQAEVCLRKAAYARQRLTALKGVRLLNQSPTFNEFLLELPLDADTVVARLLERNIAAGIPLQRYYPQFKNSLLVAVTEKRSAADIDEFAAALEELL